MRVETRVYFAVYSDVLGPEEMKARIGVPRTSVVVRKAAERNDPPEPVASAWKVDSALSPSAPLWRHLENLRDAVAPVSSAIAEVCRGEATACLHIVREFYPAGEEADLGFGLDDRWLAIISQTGARLDVDEFDYAADQDLDRSYADP
jgi:uncharacterized protein DUF4279